MYIPKKLDYKRILLTFTMIICLIFSQKYSFATDSSETSSEDIAVTVENARQQIANAALNFANSEGGKCYYYSGEGYEGVRAKTYHGGYPQESYTFECVGFVNYILHQFLGLDYGSASNGKGGFVTPSGVKDTSHFGTIGIGQIQAGDILISSTHVAIYIGDNQVVDCGQWSTVVAVRHITSSYTMVEWSACTFTSAARLISVDGVNFSPIEGGSDVTEKPDEGEATGDWDTEEVDLDEIADKFDFSGMATTVIKQDEKVDVFRWFFEGIAGFVDYIVGIILTIAIKAPILGYTNTILDIVNSFLHGLN